MIRRLLLVTILMLGAALPAAADDKPFDPIAVLTAAHKALASGDAEAAVAIYGEALENPALVDEEKIFLHFNRSRMRALQGRSDLALPDADAAVRLADRSAGSLMMRGSAHALRGLLLADVGRRDEAVTELETALPQLENPDADYADALAKMEALGPDRAERMHHNTEEMIRTVKDKLAELRGEGAKP